MPRLVSYICDVCGKTMDPKKLFTLSIDMSDGSDVFDEYLSTPPNEIVELEKECLSDKYVCERCIVDFVKGIFPKAEIVPEDEAGDGMGADVTDDMCSDNACTEDSMTKELLAFKLIEEGKTVTEVAKELGETYSRVYKAASKWDLLPKREKTKPEVNIEKLKKDYYINNMTIPELAKKYKMTISEMHQFLVKNRIEKQSKEYLKYMRQQGREAEV